MDLVSFHNTHFMKKVIIIFLSFLAVFAFVDSAKAVLTCSVTSDPCSEVTVFKMYSTSNSHAELYNQANYNYNVCCTHDTVSLGNCIADCETIGNCDVALRLSGLTNAHVQENIYSNYENDVCLSGPSGSTVDCKYDTDCTGDYICLAEISGGTNAHVGDCYSPYTTKVCCKVLEQEEFDFNISIDPSSDTVMQDNDISTGVLVTKISGDPENVFLGVADEDAISGEILSGKGITFSFSPDNNCTPNNTCSRTLIISVSSSTEIKTYNILISGTSGGASDSKIYVLTVTEKGTEINPPGVSTNSAINIASSSATLRGNLSNTGNASTCLVWFKYGINPDSLASATPVQIKSSSGSFSENLSGLIPNTIYYFKAFAKNGGSW